MTKALSEETRAEIIRRVRALVLSEGALAPAARRLGLSRSAIASIAAGSEQTRAATYYMAAQRLQEAGA